MLFVIVNMLLSVAEVDPALGPAQYRDVLQGQFISARSLPPHLLAPPVLNLSLSPDQHSIIVTISPDQPLYNGWTDTNFCSSHANWNYWWLNTRLGIDGLDSIYVLTSRYNYSNNDSDFHQIVLDNCGNRISENPQWNGYQGQPIVRDGLGDNYYIGHPVLGWLGNHDAGATDVANAISSTSTDSLFDIRFTSLDSVGNIILDQVAVATGDTGQSQTGDTHIALNTAGVYYAVWSRNMHEIVYARSIDNGVTWSIPVVIAADFTYQVNKPEIVLSADDCAHFVWQHWDGSHNRLYYKKLDGQNVCLIDTSILTPGDSIEVWAPEMTVDSDTNLHIIWASSYQGSQELYHTVINGRLDNNGLPVADSVITIVQEYPFYSSILPKRYPKVVVDSLSCLHVVFDQGAYGLNTNKQVYHLKKTRPVQGYVIYPDSSKHEFLISGNNAIIDAPLIGMYFVKVWAWNSNGETGWDTGSVYITGVAENKNGLTDGITIAPTITRDLVNIIGNHDVIGNSQISLFDIAGRRQNGMIFKKGNNRYSLSLQALPAGIYYLQIRNERTVVQQRVLRIGAE